MTTKTYFLAGVATGAGATMAASAINNAAVALIVVLAVLLGGYALGRAHTTLEQQLPPQDDDLDDGMIMIPDRSIPMEHEHGED